MNILIDDFAFSLKGLTFLQVKLKPLGGQDILRAEDGTVLYVPDDSRMEILLEGKGQVHPYLCDIRKGAKFSFFHPLPLWTLSTTPPRSYKGDLVKQNGKTRYFPLFDCLLRDFELKTELIETQVSFRFTFEEV